MLEATAPVRAEPTSPLQAARAQWGLVTVIALVALVLGAAAATRRPTLYTGESRLAVGTSTLTAQQVAGFDLASQDLAGDYARYISDGTAQVEIAKSVGPSTSQVVSIDASPIPQSNVIRIEVVSTDQGVAVNAANAVASLLQKQVATATQQNGAASTLTAFNQVTGQLTAARATLANAEAALVKAKAGISRAAVVNASAAIASAQGLVQSLTLQQTALQAKYSTQVSEGNVSNGLTVVQPGTITGDDRNSRIERYGLAGLVLGVIIALGLATFLERRRDRRYWQSTQAAQAAQAAQGTTSPTPTSFAVTTFTPPAYYGPATSADPASDSFSADILPAADTDPVEPPDDESGDVVTDGSGEGHNSKASAAVNLLSPEPADEPAQREAPISAQLHELLPLEHLQDGDDNAVPPTTDEELFAPEYADETGVTASE